MIYGTIGCSIFRGNIPVFPVTGLREIYSCTWEPFTPEPNRWPPLPKSNAWPLRLETSFRVQRLNWTCEWTIHYWRP